MSAELSTLRQSEQSLRDEQSRLVSALEKLSRGDVFEDSATYTQVARDLQAFIRDLVVRKEALEGVETTARERDRFSRLENEALEAACAELESANAQLEEAKAEVEVRVGELEVKCEELGEVAKMAGTRSEEIERSRAETSAALRAAEERIKEVEELRAKEVAELEERAADFEKLVEEAITERETIAKAAEDLAASAEQSKVDAEKAVGEAKDLAARERVELEDKIAELESKVGELQGSTDGVQTDLEEARLKIEILEAEKDESAAAHAAAIKVLQDEIEETKRNADEAKAGAGKLGGRAEQLAVEKEALDQKLIESAAALASVKEELSRAETWIQRWDAEKAELSASKELVEKQVGESATSLAAKEDQIFNLTAELTALRSSSGEAGSDLAKLHERNAELSEAIEERTKEMKSLEMERDNLKVALDRSKAKFDEHSGESETLKTQIAEMTERDNEQIELMHQMNAAIESLRGEKAALENGSGASALRLQGEVDLLAGRLEAKEQEVARLQASLTEAAADAEAAEQFVAEVGLICSLGEGCSLTSIFRQISRLESENSSLQFAIKQLEEQLASAGSESASSQQFVARISDLESQLASLTKENEELLEVNDSATTALVELETLKVSDEPICLPSQRVMFPFHL
jgi:chromosome segregation ATPase